MTALVAGGRAGRGGRVAPVLCAAAALLLAAAGGVPHAAGTGFSVDVVAGGLEVPWAMDFAPDGRIFVTERGGDIRVIAGDGGGNGSWHVSEPVRSIGGGSVEGGLLGIAVDPAFAQNGHVYVYHTHTELFATYNRVVRLTEGADGTLGDDKVLIDRIPGGPIHDGGRIRFAPDGTLYVTTGDAARPELAQDPGSLGGKILRINADGSVPEDNPWGTAVFSTGHRNPQGLDWDPATGALAVSEHGPSGERGFAHDEINVVVAGGNYGWPRTVGDEEAEGMTGPVLHSGTATWAPAGAAFYDSDAIPEFAGRFLVATLAGNHLMAVKMDARDGAVFDVERHLSGEYGRLRDVAVDGEGNVYVMTSNRDGRGSPVADDDRILRLSPDGGGGDGGSQGTGGGHHKHGDAPYESPRRQLETVSDIHDVKCNNGKVLVFKMSGWAPACVDAGSVEKLVRWGWASDHLPDHHRDGGSGSAQ